MSSNIVTTIVQGICGIVIYFVSVDLIFRVIYKNGFINYIKNTFMS